MPYNNDNNYIPETFQDVMTRFMQGVNSFFGTNFTYESFVGTGFYKYFFVAAQNVLEAENTFAEAYVKLQDYIRTVNERIAIPKTPRQGLIDTFAKAGYVISIEPQTQDNAGTLGVCVDTDPNSGQFGDRKKQILSMLKDYTVAGLYYNGEHRGNVRLSNGQDFEFAFYTPTRKEMSLKITITLSQNSNIVADNEDQVRKKLLTNLSQLYRLGNDFEPSKYFTISRDAEYASEIEIQWSLSGADNDYSKSILKANFKDLLLFAESRIKVVFK